MPTPIDPNPTPDEGGTGSYGQNISPTAQYVGAANIYHQDIKVTWKPPVTTNPADLKFYQNIIAELESLKLNIAVLKVKLAQSEAEVAKLKTDLSIMPDNNYQLDGLYQ